MKVIVVGGGAAGFFAAIAAAEAGLPRGVNPGKPPELAHTPTPQGKEVMLLEKSPQFLTKVRISGGGRCNVTHAGFDARDFTKHYPRGEKALIGAFQKFQASDTVAWFAARGVKLKTESDGRMFPTTDSSQTIMDCLLQAARKAGVKLRSNCGVEKIIPLCGTGFEIELERRSPARHVEKQEHAGPEAGAPIVGETLFCDRLLLATGGCRAAAAGNLAVSLGHTLEPPVPSLFTFHIATPWLRELAGVTVESAEVSVLPQCGTKLCERGALLVTHWGLSGPVILRLSAWGARKLHALDYKFPLRVNWLPQFTAEKIAAGLQSRRAAFGAKRVVHAPIAPLTARLWAALVLAAGIGREARWSSLTRAQQHQLVQQLTRTELPVTGKSLNKDEFVTCGGVRLGEVDFKTMASRVCPGLYFAGELLDIDGLTGGFNFQAAWTTGWIAGNAMAENV
jgi:predicted Rossmann fold flavoprotein